MSSRWLLVLSALLMLLLSAPSDAARRVPLKDLIDQAVPTVNGRPTDAATLDGAWERALREHEWTIKSAEPGRIHAALVVRTKHFVEVDIRYDAARFSILYRSSVNLNYRVDKKGTRIHPNYHKWVQWLADSFVANLKSV